LKSINYENVTKGNEIAHRPKKTSSSRFWNIMDWDGSTSLYPFGEGSPVLIAGTDEEAYPGSADIVAKDWWRVSPDCVRRDDWQTWLCPKRDGLEVSRNTILLQLKRSLTEYYVIEQIGFLYILVNGVVGYYDGSQWNEQYPPKYIGLMSQFGYPTPSDRRSTIMTNNPGVTGVTGETGWYLSMTQDGSNFVSPKRAKFMASHIPYVGVNQWTSILFSISYPTGLTFSINAIHE